MKKSKIKADDLYPRWTVEITRRCNTGCIHCCRGEKQNKTMDMNIFSHILRKHNVSDLSVSGGEPLLAYEFLYHVQGVYNLWFCTSGEIPYTTQETIVDLIAGLKSDKYREFYFEISVDKYHKTEKSRNFIDLLGQYGIDYSKRNTTQHKVPMSMGLAYYNCATDFVEEYLDIETPLFYINVQGDVYPTCEISYNFQKRFKKELCIGNAITDSSEEIKRKYLELINYKEAVRIKMNEFMFEIYELDSDNKKTIIKKSEKC